MENFINYTFRTYLKLNLIMKIIPILKPLKMMKLLQLQSIILFVVNIDKSVNFKIDKH